MRYVLAAIIVVLLLWSCSVTLQRDPLGAKDRHTRCEFPWRKTTKAKAATIRCWSEERRIDGDRVLRIARCESGSDLQDRYAADGHVGPFQQSTSYWSERARTYRAAGYPGWHVWAAAKVSTAIMDGGGWSHWTCD